MTKSEVVEFFGGKQIDVVKALNSSGYGCSKSTVSLWRETIPESWSMTFHFLTEGKLRHDPETYRDGLATDPNS